MCSLDWISTIVVATYHCDAWNFQAFKRSSKPWNGVKDMIQHVRKHVSTCLKHLAEGDEHATKLIFVLCFRTRQIGCQLRQFLFEHLDFGTSLAHVRCDTV